MTIWVGLTGGIGSGKSLVAARFQHWGVPVIDADAISRRLTATQGDALPAIRHTFGDVVFVGEELNRAALRDKVFRSPAAKQQLEHIMFPLIVAGIIAQQTQHSLALYGILDIPLLVEQTIFQNRVQRVLVVDAPEALQIERVMKRSNLSQAEIERIIATQASRAQRWGVADDILINDGSIADVQHKVDRLQTYYHARFDFLKRTFA